MIHYFPDNFRSPFLPFPRILFFTIAEHQAWACVWYIHAGSDMTRSNTGQTAWALTQKGVATYCSNNSSFTVVYVLYNTVSTKYDLAIRLLERIYIPCTMSGHLGIAVKLDILYLQGDSLWVKSIYSRIQGVQNRKESASLYRSLVYNHLSMKKSILCFESPTEASDLEKSESACSAISLSKIMSQ